MLTQALAMPGLEGEEPEKFEAQARAFGRAELLERRLTEIETERARLAMELLAEKGAPLFLASLDRTLENIARDRRGRLLDRLVFEGRLRRDELGEVLGLAEQLAARPGLMLVDGELAARPEDAFWRFLLRLDRPFTPLWARRPADNLAQLRRG